jgi:dTDP-4-dehydrorhamnose 3,5-epimerase
MIIEETPLKDCYVVRPRVFEDERGYFFESYNEGFFKDTPLEPYRWVQDNESKSYKGVLRGLHFQKGIHSQAKLVRVIIGEVYDVAVDLRKNSPTFGKHHGVLLNDKSKTQYLVPRGFAHGFLVLSEFVIFSYKCDNLYNPYADSGVLYNDEELNIQWPVLETPYLLSEKDKSLPAFDSCYKF